jgi:hypothetical protein
VSPNIADELGNQSKMNGNIDGNSCALRRSGSNNAGGIQRVAVSTCKNLNPFEVAELVQVREFQ